MQNEILFQIGLIVVVISIVLGFAATISLSLFWKKIETKLELEYGKKRR